MLKRPTELPILIISGASGFVGKYLVEALKEKYYIYALARRPQRTANIALHKNINWIRVDIANEDEIIRIFQTISNNGGADFFFHLAGYYDFEYKEKPEYELANVTGTMNILKACRSLGLKRFIFSSSQAILDFSDSNRILTEDSIPDANFPYAKSKQKGEKLVEQYSEYFPCSIVRLSAIFSDWCEYLPLYALLTTWLSKRWDRHILVGKGNTSLQYLHIYDLIILFKLIIKKSQGLPNFHFLNANPKKSISHKELFKISYRYNYFHSVKPKFIPKWFASLGTIFRIIKGKIIGTKTFERLWMMKYIDKKLYVNGKKTETLLDWKPTKRYDISRRLLFIIDRMKSNPYEFHYKNKKRVYLDPHESEYLKIYEMMAKLKGRIIDQILIEIMMSENAEKFKYSQNYSHDSRYHSVEYIFHILEIDIKTGDRSQILKNAQHLAKNRFTNNFPEQEILDTIELTATEIIKALQYQTHIKYMKEKINNEIAITLQMVMDEISDTYEHLSREI